MAVLRLFAGLILVAVMTARGVMAATAEDPFYEVVDNWQDNFRANFCITAPQDLYGWKLNLTFEEPISEMQVQRMKVLSQNPDKTEWTLGDEGHNGIWLEGERRCQDFIASKKGLTSGLQAEVQFVQLPEDTECPEQVTGQQFTMEIKNHGRNHLSGRFCLRVPRDFEDWKIQMEFASEGITSLQVANTGAVTEVPGSLNMTWLLSPANHNRVLSEGDTLCLDFDLTSQDWIRPCLRAFFTEDDGETPIEVSLPPTTTPPETTQPSSSVPDTTTVSATTTEASSTTTTLRNMTPTPPETTQPSSSVPDTTTVSATTTEASSTTTTLRNMTPTPPETTQPSSSVPDTTTVSATTTEASSTTTTLRNMTPTPPETTQPSSSVPDTTTVSATTGAPPTTTEATTTPESGSNYTELQLWKEGVNGMLCMDHAMPITCGWEAEIVFDPAIDSIDIWRAKEAGMSPYKGSGNVVHLTNMTWNYAVSDNPLCLDFNAFKSYPEAPNSVLGQFTRICNNDQWVDIPGGTGLTP